MLIKSIAINYLLVFVEFITSVIVNVYFFNKKLFFFSFYKIKKNTYTTFELS